jgi:hypothetical protein
VNQNFFGKSVTMSASDRVQGDPHEGAKVFQNFGEIDMFKGKAKTVEAGLDEGSSLAGLGKGLQVIAETTSQNGESV